MVNCTRQVKSGVKNIFYAGFILVDFVENIPEANFFIIMFVKIVIN